MLGGGWLGACLMLAGISAVSLYQLTSSGLGGTEEAGVAPLIRTTTRSKRPQWLLSNFSQV